ncbi:DUF935 domain-containing protein [Nevskia ramosa]|uniref:DUF935 domain-containing protein n=1 Tax=Nevskia ramosa TaxID=64002 RepID=UPI0023544F71|nr:DUF935 domain-containing protein [Nevskia ramosa]
MAIVDQYGRPIVLADLKREIATPTMSGVRQVWQSSIALGLTPAALAGVLRQAVEGDADSYLTLAEEMEERDLHYAAVLANRKQAVTGLQVTVEAADESAEAVKHAEFIEQIIAMPAFETMLEEQLDALGKAYSVNEIIWDTSERQWMPQAFEHRDPRWFMFDRISHRELRLRDTENVMDGLALAPFKFLVHTPRIKTGLPIRGGLARMVAFAWICKAYAMKDWVAFAEVFGMPLRVGRYNASANDDDIRVLKMAVANLGTDAAAVLPESMKIEFQEVAKNGGGADVFERLCLYIDKQVSKCVLGQTMTTDSGGGSGLAQAKVHNEVREDIQKKDAKQLAATLNQALTRPVIDLNFGPQKKYPKICINVPEPEDLAGLVSALDKLVPLGLEVEQSVIRDKFGLPEPAKGARLLMPPSAAKPEPEPLDKNGQPVKPPLKAKNAEVKPEPSTADLQTGRLAGDADPIVEALTAPIQQMLDASNSFEEFREKLLDAYDDLDDKALAELLTQGLTAANLAGRFELLLGV